MGWRRFTAPRKVRNRSRRVTVPQVADGGDGANAGDGDDAPDDEYDGDGVLVWERLPKPEPYYCLWTAQKTER